MANEDQVYAFETNFIAALETILDVALTQTVAFGDTTTHQTPRIEVGFTYGGANPVDRGLTSEGKQYLRKHSGTIRLTVSGTVKADHLALVGKVRNFMSWNVPTLINPVLEFYQVQSVFEQGGSNESGEEDGDFEIETEMNFDVVFHIPPLAFNTYLIASGDGIDPDIAGLRFYDTGETQNGQPVYRTLDTDIGTDPSSPFWTIRFSSGWLCFSVDDVGFPLYEWDGPELAIDGPSGDYVPIRNTTGTLTITSSADL